LFDDSSQLARRPTESGLRESEQYSKKRRAGARRHRVLTLGASQMTIRRDPDFLDAERLALRAFGGALRRF
jgi:hypothetical protein